MLATLSKGFGTMWTMAWHGHEMWDRLMQQWAEKRASTVQRDGVMYGNALIWATHWASWLLWAVKDASRWIPRVF